MDDDVGEAFQGLHHVRLAIPEGAEDTRRACWGDILGFTELEKPPAIAAGPECPGYLLERLADQQVTLEAAAAR